MTRTQAERILAAAEDGAEEERDAVLEYLATIRRSGLLGEGGREAIGLVAVAVSRGEHLPAGAKEDQ